MKLLKSIFILVWFLPIFGKSQTFFDNYYAVGYNNLMSCNVIATEDSNFIFVNYVQDSVTGRQDAGVITIDKNGNEILHNSFNYFNTTCNTFFNRKHFIQISKNSFFFSGIDPNGNGIAYKISKSPLDTIKTKKLENTNYYFYMNNFIRIHSNKFLWIGSLSYSSSVVSTLVMELDTNLNVINQFTTCTSLSSGNHSAVLNSVNRSLMLVGRSFSPAPYLNTQTLMDTLGTVITSSTSVSSISTNIVQVYFSAIDTSYVCVGGMSTAKINGYPMSKLCISKYDRSLKLLWQKMYGQNTLDNALSNAVILPDGSIVACGVYSKLTSTPLINADNNGVILKVDKDGHFRWMREYSHFGPAGPTEGFYGIDRALDKGFILCGSTMNQPNAKAWAVKTDSMGCVTPGCVSSTITVDSLIIPKDTTVTTSVTEFFIPGYELRVYPNPAKGDFVVESVSDEPKVLSISDLQGREIKQIVLRNKETVSTSDLSPGVYLLQLYREGQLLSTKKIVVLK